ncbi:MAG TPA: c-type cytochrome domain-containing protein [Chthonomonadaceae bacterium]|nr:c-type cytochrome domain-containing protein [Chthonomonadaceae bacterium]
MKCGLRAAGGARWFAAVRMCVLAATVVCSGTASRADTFTSADGALAFEFPRRWQAEADGARIRITAPDGSHFFVTRDSISTLPGASPAANPDLNARAAELVRPLLPGAALAAAQPVAMDHGVGAAFRFTGPAKGGATPALTVYIAFVGRHSIVILPERAGQAAQTIGLAAIVQSLAFPAEMPKPALPPNRPAGAAPGGGPISGPGTIDYSRQIAPIFKDKCEVCHRATAALGGFSVTSYADLVRGGRSGAAIVAGSPDSSRLLDYLTGRRELMPKGGPALPADQIELIRKWIAEGARQQVGGPVAPGAGAPPGDGAIPRPRQGPGAANGPARRTAMRTSSGPQLLEGYSGHLVATDSGFTLRLYQDKTASAVWSIGPGREVRYAGTYTGENDSYIVTLTQAGSPAVEAGKTMTINMTPRGSQESGFYGLDGARPRREITDLELTESQAFAAPPNGAGRARANNQNRRRPGK